MNEAREERLIRIIKGLISNIRAKHKEHGSEYCGGMPIQFALSALESMGITVEDEECR